MADHTAILAATLCSRFEVSVLTSAGARVRSPAGVVAEVADWSDPVELVVALSQFSARTSFIWQYVPHAYGRGGVIGTLPRVMSAFRGRGGRQMVIAHEIRSPLSLWPHRLWYAWSHRRQWERIVAAADYVGVSTEVWVEQCRAAAPGRESAFELLATPSTIPVAQVPEGLRSAWRRELGLREETRVLLAVATTDAKGFEGAVVGLAEDVKRRQVMEERGRGVYVERYAWRHVDRRLSEWLLEGESRGASEYGL